MAASRCSGVASVAGYWEGTAAAAMACGERLGLGFREGRGSRGGSTRGGPPLMDAAAGGTGTAAKEDATATAWRGSAIAVATVARERADREGPLSAF